MAMINTNDIVNLGYQNDGEIVYIVYTLKDVFAQTYVPGPDKEPVLELQPFSWSIPASEIDGITDPIDYLKQVIVDANQ